MRGLSGQEIAELLQCSLASVNSALQRARATLAGRQPAPGRTQALSDGRICGLNAFRSTDRLFPLFGLPPQLDG